MRKDLNYDSSQCLMDLGCIYVPLAEGGRITSLYGRLQTKKLHNAKTRTPATRQATTEALHNAINVLQSEQILLLPNICICQCIKISKNDCN